VNHKCGPHWEGHNEKVPMWHTMGGGRQIVAFNCGPHWGVGMSVSLMWATLGDPQCGNPGVDHIGIFLETPNVDPLCGPPNATLGETRPQ
jgi:hypothetical protein